MAVAQREATERRRSHSLRVVRDRAWEERKERTRDRDWLYSCVCFGEGRETEKEGGLGG